MGNGRHPDEAGPPLTCFKQGRESTPSQQAHPHSRAELYWPTLIHMHQGKKKVLMLLVSLVMQMHQVVLRKVHHGEENANSKVASLFEHQGISPSSSAPVPTCGHAPGEHIL
jgi:hypothetical protein